LGEGHEDDMFEPSAYDHVSDGRGNKLFHEPFIAFFIDEISREVLPLMAELDPSIGFEHFSDIFQLVVGGDLVEFIELALKYFLVEGRLF